MKIRHIYWFALYKPDSPSVRYRGTYPLGELSSNHQVTFSIIYPGYRWIDIIRFLRTYFSALLWRKKDSLIVIQRVYTKKIYACALAFLVLIRRRDTLYDIDDAEYVQHPPGMIRFFMKHCSNCSVGSSALLDYAGRYNKTPFLMTSPVTSHGFRKERVNKVFTIGWIGCFWGAHEQSLNKLFFQALTDIDFPVRLVILGARNSEAGSKLSALFSSQRNIEIHVPLDIDWFNEEDIYRRIREFDVGISPLLDTEINRAKSAYKLKQYFSAGVPVLASELGENQRFLKHGINGFFCNSPDDFKKHLLLMMNMDSQEYGSFSDQAIATVSKFSMNHYCETLLGHFENQEEILPGPIS